MSSQQSNEGEIRKNLLEADLVDCMVALPGQLFYSTQIPACLWLLSRSRGNGPFRNRLGEVLFIDARRMGVMRDRTHREFTDDEINRIANTYHAWRGEAEPGEYTDVPSFCYSASLEEIRKHDHIITPGRYVGFEPRDDSGEPFDQKMLNFAKQLRIQQSESRKLDTIIESNLIKLGF